MIYGCFINLESRVFPLAGATDSGLILTLIYGTFEKSMFLLIYIYIFNIQAQ